MGLGKYDVVIIGSGLGGLQCGYILSKHGLNVCVLEKNAQPGGCLQTFRRGHLSFDTGFHYVGGLDAGQPLHRLFDYFHLLDLPWRRLDENGFDEVVIHDKSYMFANGYESFAETLVEHFPDQKENLKKYTSFLRNVSENIFNSFVKQNDENLYGASLFTKSAYDYLCTTIDNPLLRQVLSGTSLKMELNAQTLPLYIFAQINSSYIQSAWRLQGGGSQIADALIKYIRANGGTVRMNAEVTRLIEADGKITAVEVNGFSDKKVDTANYEAEHIEADFFIADTHPAAALALIHDSKLIRDIYRKRVTNLENSFGLFTVNIALKENVAPYQNRNIYIHKTEDVWQHDDYHPDCVLVSFQIPNDYVPDSRHTSFSSNIDLLTPMYWQEIEQWNRTGIGHRGTDYLSFKNKKFCLCCLSSQTNMANKRKRKEPDHANSGYVISHHDAPY